MFTPWGEGLVRSWYRRTLAELSHLPHIGRVAIQTNLSCRTDWLAEADLNTLALWCTYHPGQTPYDRFLSKCAELAERGVRFSVGVVGLPGHLESARRLRADLLGARLPVDQRGRRVRLRGRRGRRVDRARPPLPVQPPPARQQPACPAVRASR